MYLWLWQAAGWPLQLYNCAKWPSETLDALKKIIATLRDKQENTPW